MKEYINNKNNELYYVLGKVINATNAQNNQAMILYINSKDCDLNKNRQFYVRRMDEFFEKFSEVIPEDIKPKIFGKE